MLIGVDFDGVIHDWKHPVPGRRMGPPMPNAKEALDLLHAEGHKILIHSCNNPKVIKDFMEYYKLPYDHIWEMGKPNCDMFIDDRGWKFEDWSSTLEEVFLAKQA